MKLGSGEEERPIQAHLTKAGHVHTDEAAMLLHTSLHLVRNKENNDNKSLSTTACF